MLFTGTGPFYFSIFGFQKINTMRLFFFCLLAGLLTACKSPGKKDPDQAIDDTTRMDNPPVADKFQPVRGTAADVPASIRLKGSVNDLWKWNDARGENIFITTVVAPYDDSRKNEYGEEGQTAELYAYQFVKNDTGYKQLWMLHETELSCPFDITCAFAKDAVTVTDLDADHQAEVTLLYKMACRSDVSPAVMKLLMREGEYAHSLKGLTWVQGGPGEKFTVTEKDACLETLPGYKGTDAETYQTFGRYESEKEFRGAPIEFLYHARQQWMLHVKESFE
jgi:hypothetical protein